jgi:hypothetical protein
LCGKVNWHSCRIRGSENPHALMNMNEKSHAACKVCPFPSRIEWTLLSPRTDSKQCILLGYSSVVCSPADGTPSAKCFLSAG